MSLISIHAPLAGRDKAYWRENSGGHNFNPRAPCGARHAVALNSAEQVKFQSTRPLRGATRAAGRGAALDRISIHAPLAGRDRYKEPTGYLGADFNPRAPCGARLPVLSGTFRQINFNPRAPCGARRPCCATTRGYRVFQSTRPLRGATFTYATLKLLSGISIHAPLAGRDVFSSHDVPLTVDFNPRAPCGARRHSQSRTGTAPNFNPRAPCGARRGQTR